MAKEAEPKPAEDKGSDVAQMEFAVPLPPPSVLSVLLSNLRVIDKAIRTKETRTSFGRVLRQTALIRKRLRVEDVRQLVEAAIPAGSDLAASLDKYLSQVPVSSMESDGAPISAPLPLAASPPAHATPEAEAYGWLLAVVCLLDAGQAAPAASAAAEGLGRLQPHNRRTLDVLQARLWQYLCLATERQARASAAAGSPAPGAASGAACAGLVPRLLAAHQAATLRRDEAGQETLLALALRALCDSAQYEAADALAARAARPTTPRLAPAAARLLFYEGRVRAVQLRYGEARLALTAAARKAPAAARGFRTAALAWKAVVTLLLGEVPDRAELAASELEAALRPYRELAAAVRSGDAGAYAALADRHRRRFAADGLAGLVGRLRHVVLRAGLRRLGAAYSRVSLADVAQALSLGSAADAEAVVSKALLDGGLEGSVDHERGELITREPEGAYATAAPREALHARVAFCLDLAEDAARAMRYDLLGDGVQLDDADRVRERAEAELAAALEEEMEDD